MIEQERKRAYNERTLQTDHGTFIPLVFSIKDNMGKECQKFYSRLAQLISENRDLPQSIWSNWIREKDCFGLVRSNLLCLRGLRTVCRKTAEGAIQKGYPHIFSDFGHPLSTPVLTLAWTPLSLPVRTDTNVEYDMELFSKIPTPNIHLPHPSPYINTKKVSYKFKYL